MGVLHNQIISDVERVLNKQGLTPEQTAQHFIDLAERLNIYGRALARWPRPRRCAAGHNHADGQDHARGPIRDR